MIFKKRAALYLLVSLLLLLFSFSVFYSTVAASPPYFPLTKESFTNCDQVTQEGTNYTSCKLGDDFGARRSSGTRCHKGVDVYVNNKGAKGDVVAVDDGKILFKMPTFIPRGGCSDGYDSGNGQASALAVYHSNLDKTIIYGELRPSDTRNFSKGDKVKAGQVLGEASVCGMLHFELYQGEYNRYDQWYPPGNEQRPRKEKVPYGRPNYCANNYSSTKESELINPQSFLERLKGNWAKSPSETGKTDTDITEKLPSDIPKPSVLKNPLNTKTIPGLIGSIADTVLSIVGSLALLAFVVGGVRWLVSGGKPEQIKKGANTMLYAIIGLFVVFGSYAILKLIIEALQNAG